MTTGRFCFSVLHEETENLLHLPGLRLVLHFNFTFVFFASRLIIITIIIINTIIITIIIIIIACLFIFYTLFTAVTHFYLFNFWYLTL